MSGELEAKLRDLQVRTRDWTDEATQLAAKAMELDATARRELPAFPGVYQRQEIERYLGRLRDAIEQPLKERARRLLEESGIAANRVTDETLLDLDGVWALADAFRSIKEALPIVAARLVEKGWLTELAGTSGVDRARHHLVQLYDHRSILQRLIETAPLGPFTQHLLDDCLNGAANLAQLRPLLDDVARVVGYRVVMTAPVTFGRLQGRIHSVIVLLDKLQEVFGVDREDIDRQVVDKDLDDAATALEEYQRRCDQQRSELRAELATYAELLDVEVENGGPLLQLKRRVAGLRTQCEEKLGAGGMDLVRYLRGEGEYPEHVGAATVRRTLEFLRPRFQRTLN